MFHIGTYKENLPWIRAAVIFMVVAGIVFTVSSREGDMAPLWSWLVGAGAGSFVLCGLDKKAASAGKWRIPENALFLSAVFGGALGLIAGMKAFRHKTRKASFQVVVFTIAVLQFLIVVRIYNRF